MLLRFILFGAVLGRGRRILGCWRECGLRRGRFRRLRVGLRAFLGVLDQPSANRVAETMFKSYLGSGGCLVEGVDFSLIQRVPTKKPGLAGPAREENRTKSAFTSGFVSG